MFEVNRPGWSIAPFLISDNYCMLIILTLSNRNLNMVFPISVKLALNPLLATRSSLTKSSHRMSKLLLLNSILDWAWRFAKFCPHPNFRWFRPIANECKFQPTRQLRFQISLSHFSIRFGASRVSHLIIRSFYMVLDWAHSTHSCFGIDDRVIWSMPVIFRMIWVYSHCFIVVCKKFETAVLILRLAVNLLINLKVFINISVWVSLDHPLFFG